MKTVNVRSIISRANAIETAPGMYAAECIVEYGWEKGGIGNVSAKREFWASCPFNIFLRFKDSTCGIAACDGLYDLLEANKEVAEQFEAFFLSQRVGRNSVRLPQLGERGTFECGEYLVWWNIAGCSNNYLGLVGEQVDDFRPAAFSMKPETRWAICNVAYNEISGVLEESRKAAIKQALMDLAAPALPQDTDWTWNKLKKSGYTVRKFRVTCIE